MRPSGFAGELKMEIVLEDRGVIPGWVKDHASFRRWVRSPDFPESGQYGWLGNKLWMDLSMERNSHNQIKMRVGQALMNHSDAFRLGCYWGDRMLLTHLKAGLSTEPDGMFAKWETIRSRRVRLVGGKGADGSEVRGTPDMVLEVVSPKSVRKDLQDLPQRYWAAGIPEYWLVDPRSSELRFDILRRGSKGYRKVPAPDGWRKSAVFGAAFRMRQTADPLGEPAYTLEVR
jgi:Uma2 family endonuclease